MSKISELKNNSNIEDTVNGLFELIIQKDKNISNDLHHFDGGIILKSIGLSKELVSTNLDNELFMEKKTQLESYYKDISRFTQIFDLLDKKLDNEIKTNISLSKTDREDLQHEFLFDVRRKHLGFFSTQKQCETILSVIDEKLNNNFEKPTFLDKIKTLRNNFTDTNDSVKNKLK